MAKIAQPPMSTRENPPPTQQTRIRKTMGIFLLAF
jgi:hypothetical protein